MSVNTQIQCNIDIVYKMRRICPGLLLFLTLAKPNYVLSSMDVDVVDTAKNFIDSSKDISETFEAAANFAKKLQFLGGALGVLAAFGNDDESGHREIMKEFAQVHNGIADLKEQISYLEANMELQHLKTRLFKAFEVLRQANRWASIDRHKMEEYCNKNECVDALEQLARHAPDLLEAYINTIKSEQDFVTLVPAYAHRLLSVIGNSARVVKLNMKDVDDAYIGLKESGEKIERLVEGSKWRWTKILANIEKDTKAIMQKGRHHSNLHVLNILTKELRPKFFWLSLGILVYNNVRGFDKHLIKSHNYGNQYIHFFRESGKNAVVFYKIKKYDSFRGGKIGKDKCRELCPRAPRKNCAIWEGQPCGKHMADSCRVKDGGVDATATIKRYVGLWFDIPSDYNYCYSNNRFFTNIAIKMYWHTDIRLEGSTSLTGIYEGINKYSDKSIDSTILYTQI